MNVESTDENAQPLDSEPAMWWVRGALPGFSAIGGDVLSTHEWGSAFTWRRKRGRWKEVLAIEPGFTAIAAWWDAGLIAPSTVEDGDRFQVHRLLDELENDGTWRNGR